MSLPLINVDDPNPEHHSTRPHVTFYSVEGDRASLGSHQTYPFEAVPKRKARRG